MILRLYLYSIKYSNVAYKRKYVTNGAGNSKKTGEKF